MDAARMLKANMKMDGKPCGWCQVALHLGDDTAQCTTCEKEHHARCWEHSGGCSTPGCVNAPLRRLDAGAGAAPTQPAYGAPPSPYAPPPGVVPPGYMACPHCRAPIIMGAQICPMCRAITSPDGIYHGPKMNAPGASAALVFGLIGLVFCQIVMGPLAIVKSNEAKRAMANDPTLGGEGMANAGLVLGIIDLALFVIWIVVFAAKR